MRGFATIYRRELAGLFFGPLAWVLLCLGLAYNGAFFLFYLKSSGGLVNAALELSLGGGLPFWFLIVLLPPLITMRMISEEHKSGMLELLLTAPVGDAAVVLGKAFAATTFLALFFLVVPLYGLLLAALGAPPDWGQVATGYFGTVLTGALFSAVGLCASSLCGTPLLAAFLAALANLTLVFLPFATSGVRGYAPRFFDWIGARVNVIGAFQG